MKGNERTWDLETDKKGNDHRKFPDYSGKIVQVREAMGAMFVNPGGFTKDRNASGTTQGAIG